MGDELFTKFEYIKQIGDDNLPHDMLQIDIEKNVGFDEDGKSKYQHICRVFVAPDLVKRYIEMNQK